MTDAKVFIAVLKKAGLKPRNYSGRFMFGKACVAITTGDPFSAGVNVGLAMALSEFPRAFSASARYDSLGRETVIYWPDLAWPDDEDAADDDD